MCFRRALAHWSYEHKILSSLGKLQSLSVPTWKQTPHAPSTPCEWTSFWQRSETLTGIISATTALGCCESRFYYLNCLSFPSALVWKQGRNAGHNTEVAVWGKWKVLEKRDYWLWEIPQITQTAEGSKKKTVTADKEINKKMDKGVRRNTRQQTSV